MKNEELQIDYGYYDSEQCSFDDLKQATAKLTVATQGQFEEIKNEKWFNRVFDMVTFSKKNEIRMANQIGNVAQAQQIMMEILIRLSTRDSKISDLVAESFDKIKRLSENDILLGKKLIQLENSYLGISKQTDIDELSETESHILGGLFYDLMNNFEVISDQQRTYANAILTYLDVEAQKIDIKQSIESINNIDKKRKILTCCMEYGYLNQFNFDYIDNMEDMIDDFDFGNKTIKMIKEGIAATYNLRGVDGFIDKYDYDEDFEFDEEFSMEFDDEISEASENEPEEIEMTEIETNTILNITQGETKIFKNNIIHFHSYINCAGNLIFENCVVSYNVSETSDEISLAEGATVEFINCQIVCENTDESFFIQGSNENEVTLLNCDLINCSYFLNMSHGKLQIENCRIINPSVCFINGDYEVDGMISNSQIKFSKIPDQNRLLIKKSSSYEAIFKISKKESFLIKSCLIEGDSLFVRHKHQITIFDTVNGIFENCSFININNCITMAEEIIESKFLNCGEPIVFFGIRSNKNAKLIDSTFEGCEKVLNLTSGSIITGCQFNKCKNRIIDAIGSVTIEFCEFFNSYFEENNDYTRTTCLEFYRGDQKNELPSKVKKCLFKGIDIRNSDATFILASGLKDRVVVYIEDCDFQNCATKNEDASLVNENGTYKNIFKKYVNFKSVEVSNCKGMEKVNKSQGFIDDVILKTSTSNGSPIGANISINIGSTLDIKINLNEENEDISSDIFECVSVIMPESNGCIIVNREYGNVTPINNMTYSELASINKGSRIGNVMGFDCKSIDWEEFFLPEDSFTRIVWMSKELKDKMAKELNEKIRHETGIENFTSMVCDETIAIDSDGVIEYLESKGHPALAMDPIM